MTDRQWHEIEQAIEAMSVAERRELIKRVERRLPGNGRNPNRERVGADELTTAERQHGAWREIWNELSKLSVAPEPADGLIGSRDHDKILYDGSSRTGFPERPRS